MTLVTRGTRVTYVGSKEGYHGEATVIARHEEVFNSPLSDDGYRYTLLTVNGQDLYQVRRQSFVTREEENDARTLLSKLDSDAHTARLIIAKLNRGGLTPAEPIE